MPSPSPDNHQKKLLFLLAVGAAVLAWSGTSPRDRLTWWLEIAPILIVVPILIATRRRFPLTPLLYGLVLAHAVILMIGGHYTYAEVPAGFWVRDLLGLTRNPYDRLGHLAQGFVPALAVREVLLRRTPLQRGGWLIFLTTSVCLAISALYELFEWWAAVLFGGSAAAFLGTQGDVWDTQWDMFLALTGALLALLLVGRAHDRALTRLRPAPASAGPATELPGPGTGVASTG